MTESAGAKPQEQQSSFVKPKRDSAKVKRKQQVAMRRGEGDHDQDQAQDGGLFQARPAVRPLDAGALDAGALTSQVPAAPASVSRFAQDLSQVPANSLQLKREEEGQDQTTQQEKDGARSQVTAAGAQPAPAAQVAPVSTPGQTQSTLSALPGGGVVQTLRVPFAQVIARTPDGSQAQQEGEQEQVEEPITIPQVGETPEETQALDGIASTLTYHSSIEQGGAGPEGFGICRCNGSLHTVTITPGSGNYTVAGTFEIEIRWSVRSGVGPGGRVDLASPDDPDLKACNYQRAVWDLTPNMGDLGGRPPRSKFWCQDLTQRHELVHADDYQTYGEDASEAAQAWLNDQTADSRDHIADTLVNQALHEGWDTLIALMASPPGAEPRAYGDGAGPYQARADAIQNKGDAGDYGQIVAEVTVGPKGGGSYEVVSGDTLSAIAERTYGEARYWREIYQANRDRVGQGGDLIHPGTVLDLPQINIDQQVMVSFTRGGSGFITEQATVPGGGSHRFSVPPQEVFTAVDVCDRVYTVAVVDPTLNTLLSAAWHVQGVASTSRDNLQLSVSISR